MSPIDAIDIIVHSIYESWGFYDDPCDQGRIIDQGC